MNYIQDLTLQTCKFTTFDQDYLGVQRPLAFSRSFVGLVFLQATLICAICSCQRSTWSFHKHTHSSCSVLHIRECLAVVPRHRAFWCIVLTRCRRERSFSNTSHSKWCPSLALYSHEDAEVVVIVTCLARLPSIIIMNNNPSFLSHSCTFMHIPVFHTISSPL